MDSKWLGTWNPSYYIMKNLQAAHLNGRWRSFSMSSPDMEIILPTFFFWWEWFQVHPWKWTAGTEKSPNRKGTSSSKPPFLGSMLIFQGVCLNWCGISSSKTGQKAPGFLYFLWKRVMPSLCPLAGGSTKMDKHGIITRDKLLLFNSSGTPAKSTPMKLQQVGY